VRFGAIVDCSQTFHKDFRQAFGTFAMTFEPERPVMVLAGLRKGIYGLRPQNRQIRSFKDPRIAGFLKEPYLVFLRS
jgi:hypothetical protein